MHHPLWRAIMPGFAFLLALSACAASHGPRHGPGGPGGGETQAGRVIEPDEAARLIERARMLETEKGCAEAVGTYRVIAAYGRHFEVAQRELAQCLMEANSDIDRAEAMVWLERAAMAGDEPAQRLLAEALIAHARGEEDYRAALTWALIYNASNDRALTPMADLSPAFLIRARAQLTPEAIAAAETHAAAFMPAPMAAFVVPQQMRARAGGGGMPPGGRGGEGGMPR